MSIVFNIENVVKMSVKQAVTSELKNLKNKYHSINEYIRLQPM